MSSFVGFVLFPTAIVEVLYLKNFSFGYFHLHLFYIVFHYVVVIAFVMIGSCQPKSESTFFVRISSPYRYKGIAFTFEPSSFKAYITIRFSFVSHKASVGFGRVKAPISGVCYISKRIALRVGSVQIELEICFFWDSVGFLKMYSIKHWGAVVALYPINKVRTCTLYTFPCFLGAPFIGVISHRVPQELAYFLQTYERKEIAGVLVSITHN